MSSIKRWTWGVTFLTAVVILTSGCEHKKKSVIDPRLKEASTKAQKGHVHSDPGPHGGVLAEWGEEEYHAEFTVDHAKKQATVYILDGQAKNAVPIASETIELTLTNVTPPVQIALQADPQKEDPKGSASRFVGTHDQLGTEMEFKGEISGQVARKPYTGTFEEKEHKHK